MNPSGQPSAATDPWVGRVVGGRWKVISLLDDSGGMANVYLAEDTRLERKAVVKIPRAAHLNAEFAERFAREARWHAQVENVHVVTILDRGEEAGTPFLVLQYLPGGNLKAWCARNASMLADPRLHFDAWLLPIAQALDAVASKGIVHRDVKPTNILFDAMGKGYLSDFGIVKAGSEATLTGTGLFIGTLQFMSPEQCQNERVALDGRSDQYGLAVTVYQVLTGWKYPTVDDTAVVYAAKFGHTRMTHPREHTPLVPQEVNDAVMRALSPHRDDRFTTSAEFAKAVLAAFATANTGLHGGAASGASAVDTPSTRRPGPEATASGRERKAAPPARVRTNKGLLAAAGAILAIAAVAGVAMLRTKHAGTVDNPGRTDVAAADPGTSAPRPADPPVVPAPRVTALKAAADRPLKAGDELELVATFSRAVTVTGTPRIEFTVGREATRREAVFVRGDGTDRLVFLFEVPDGGIDGTGIALAEPPAIDLAGGRITDAVTGRAADLPLVPPPTLAALRIDGLAPTIETIAPPQGLADRRTGDRLEFRVTFDEPVVAEGTPALEFTAGSQRRRAVCTDTTAARTLVFDYTVAAGDESGDGVTVTTLVLAGGSIHDVAGNAAEISPMAKRSPSFAINPKPTPPPAVAMPAGPRPGTVETNSIGMKLALVPAGEFEMGSTDTRGRLERAGFKLAIDGGEGTDERPVHRVRISRPFLMGIHEVTLAEFLVFYHGGFKGRLECEKNGEGGWGYDNDELGGFPVHPPKPKYRPWSWGHPGQTMDHPVVNVSWNDCAAFCAWLSRKEGKHYRLPTEAEWEYACRGDSTTRFWFGDDPEGLAARDNVADGTFEAMFSQQGTYAIQSRDGYVFTSPVGSFDAPNPFGLHDMHGNVCEWCSDWSDAYADGPVTDPAGPAGGVSRSIRGGSWYSMPYFGRSAHRLASDPSSLNTFTGFRVVCDLQ